MPPVQLLDEALLARVTREALASPRLRTNHNFHAGPEDNPHRFLNAMARGTYVTPHRHLSPPKAESFILLRGAVACFLFDDAGDVTEIHRLGGAGEPLGIDVAAGIWHSLVVRSDVAILYEVKPGPWVPATDKEFAPWAPREGTTGCPRYLRALEERLHRYAPSQEL